MWTDMYSLALALGGQCRGGDGKQISVGVREPVVTFPPQLGRQEGLTFTEYMLCVRHHSKHFVYIMSFNSQNKRYNYYIHLTGEGTGTKCELL